LQKARPPADHPADGRGRDLHHLPVHGREEGGLAQEHLDECIASQRLFERNADLFPIRDRGGVYFVPGEHASFVDGVQSFLGKVNGRLARFPVPAGTPHGDSSVKDAVASGLACLIEEHRAAIAAFGEDTRPSTLQRAAERIRLTRHKLEAYSCYLAGERERLEKDLTVAAGELRAKVDSISSPSS
jgi:hypothetical protein